MPSGRPPIGIVRRGKIVKPVFWSASGPNVELHVETRLDRGSATAGKTGERKRATRASA
jgi:hypothetical protein